MIALGMMLVHAQPGLAEEGEITQMARQAGSSTCLPTIAKLEHHFGNKRSYGSWSFWSNKQTAKQPFNASMEISYSDGSTLIDFTVIPAADGTCSYVYTKTWYSPNSCAATAKHNFMRNAKYKGQISERILAYTLGAAEFLLQPAGSGCMVQKKELGFQFDKQHS
ncbi:MAG: hypothetical protein R8K53_05630 [Mariprofundaceae bacterium]